jgi:DNA-binding CsgD family transcriptional regulator
VAATCAVLLACLGAIEILTPDVVVGALALLPLLAAVWVLSDRPAALVGLVAILCFGVAVAVEDANRLTVIIVAAAVLTVGYVARRYATGLALLLSSRRQRSDSVRIWAIPPTPNDGDGFAWSARLLTRRERDVARLAIEGYTATEIAARLRIGRRTVESHLAGVYSKLGIRSRPQLIRLASNGGISAPAWPPEVHPSRTFPA